METKEVMETKEKKLHNGTFIIEIQHRENTSWQGKVKWVDRDREQYFRSALELFKMIEHALDEEEKISPK